MRDVMGALRLLVLTSPEIMDVLAESDTSAIPPATDRVFINLIPKEVNKTFDTFHPPKTLVLRQAGGLGKNDLTALDQPTITTLCYGEDTEQADRVRRAVWSRFVRLQRECFNDVLIHDMTTTGGAIPSVESDTVWPAVAQSYTLTADVLSAA